MTVTTIDTVNLYSAGTSLGLANTSDFLLRRLEDDSAVTAIRSVATDEMIFDALLAAIAKKPVTLEDRVRPFVLLVALSRSSNMRHLDKAATLSPLPDYHHWYFEILRTLQDSKFPVSFSTVKLSAPKVSVSSSATNIVKKGARE